MELARRIGAEIVSVDSMQVYRGMDIGTAKPSSSAQCEIRHHLVDLVEPDVSFSVAEFQAAGRAAMQDAAARQVPVIIVGGSGLHYRSLVDPLEFPPTDDALRARLEARSADARRRELLELDPVAGEHVDLENPRRVLRALEVARLTGEVPSQRADSPKARAVREFEPAVPFVAIGLDPAAKLAARAERRFDAMLDAGLLAEVAGLAPRLGTTARQAVGYKELLPVVEGHRGLAAGRRAAIDATTSLASRQRTFFRKDPRITWLPWHDEVTRRVDAAYELLEHAWTS